MSESQGHGKYHLPPSKRMRTSSDELELDGDESRKFVGKRKISKDREAYVKTVGAFFETNWQHPYTCLVSLSVILREQYDLVKQSVKQGKTPPNLSLKQKIEPVVQSVEAFILPQNVISFTSLDFESQQSIVRGYIQPLSWLFDYNLTGLMGSKLGDDF